LILLFAQPLLLFVFSIIVWSLQSFLVTGISRRFIFPSFYKNKITTFFVAQISIFVHEMSHFLSAIFTGSSIVGEETFVTATQGRVTAASEESVIGWFSRMIAALAPSFVPPLIFLIIFFLVSGQTPELITKFTYPKTIDAFQTMLTTKFIDVVIPNLSVLILSIINFTNPLTFLFIYLLIVCSIAAGPSEGDWKATLSLFLSPISIIALLVIFLFLSIAFAQFNLSFVIPLMLLIAFIFVVVMIGIFYAFLVSQLLSIAYKNVGYAIALLIVFFAIYYAMYYFAQDVIVSFSSSIIVSLALGAFIKTRNKHNKH